MKIYLFFFVLIFFLIAFVFRSLLAWKQTGKNPIVLSNSDDIHGFQSKLFKMLILSEFVLVGFYSFTNLLDNYLIKISFFTNSSLEILGWVLLHLSLLIVFVAQLQMSDSWRIGIDFGNETNLITSGLFSKTRNPIYLGLLMSNVGLFLVMPNPIVLLIIVGSYISIETQVRLEEAYLLENNKEYQTYFKEVKRWL